MEIEELKHCWNSLSLKLEEKEIVEKQVLCETIKSRVKSTYDKLFQGELTGLILNVIIVACVLPLFYIHSELRAFWLIEAVMCFGVVWCGISTYRLSKFDYSAPVREMSKRILAYQRDLKIGLKVWPPIIFLTIAACYAIERVSVYSYLILAASIVVATVIITIGMKKKFYEIKALQDDLDKLQED